MVAVACGGSDDEPASSSLPVNDGDEPVAEEPVAEPGDDQSLDPAQAAEDILESDDPLAAAEDLAEDLAEQAEAAQAVAGGGGFTIAVGDESWTFDSVLCAFGEDQIGQEGAEFVLSSIQDGLQAYVSIDNFGYSVSVDDISDFQNPSVSLSTFQDATINLDGKNVSGEGLFVDGTSDSFAEVAGTFSGSCP